MSASLTLDRRAVAVEPTVGALFPKPPDGPLFTVDPAVVATARELDALVSAARMLVTVDPAWALWALECAVDAEFLVADTIAMSLLAAGVDALYLAERRAGPRGQVTGTRNLLAPAGYDHHVGPQIDRHRLDAAFDLIGHLGKAAFRARIADAYDATATVA